MNLVIKAILLSALVVFCMQIKWEGQTLEEKTLGTLEDSGLTSLVHDVALGGIEAAKDLYEKATR